MHHWICFSEHLAEHSMSQLFPLQFLFAVVEKSGERYCNECLSTGWPQGNADTRVTPANLLTLEYHG